MKRKRENCFDFCNHLQLAFKCSWGVVRETSRFAISKAMNRKQSFSTRLPSIDASTDTEWESEVIL
jgi:hypothetical protein